MKRFISYNFWLVLALATVAFFLYFYFCSSGQNKVCLNGHCFIVELALNNVQREKGLMFRDSLPAGRGMLFVFDNEEHHSMWMKNTKIPLDMVFINKDLEIIHVAENVAPCVTEQCPIIGTAKKSLYVLEINAGLAREAKITVGQIAELFLKK